MQNKNRKAIALSIFLIVTIAASMTLVKAQVTPVAGSHIPTYAKLNVYPLLVGVGQQITLNMFLATPLETSGTPHNFTINVVPPTGSNITLGPFTGDTTGGTVGYYTPTMTGNYTFQFFYPGEALGTATSGYASLINDASNSIPVTVVVQEEPVVQTANFPYTPLPTQWWQTPVSAQNSQNWYAITGPWLGLSAITFAASGGYNVSSMMNPWTEDVMSGHVLWTTPWLTGGLSGGQFGGDEVMGHFWSTFQYTPRYAPVIMNGVIYSSWYTFGFSTSAYQGIRALDLYTGKQLWVINTTSVLRCGWEYYQYTINDYGTRGPWLWTTGTLPAADVGGSIPSNNSGTQWNLFDAQTGKYCMSVVNGSGLTFGTDAKGELIGYFLNSTAGAQVIAGNPQFGTNVLENFTTGQPHVTAVNMTVCAGFTASMSPTNTAINTFRAMKTGFMWDKAAPNNISGVTINPALAISTVTGNEIVLTGGFVHGQGAGSEVPGWFTFGSMDINTGNINFVKNITYPTDGWLLPYTRTGQAYADGYFINMNLVSHIVDGYRTDDGTKAWEVTLTGDNGADANPYDQFGTKTNIGPGVVIWSGLGGDVWCQNVTNGDLVWYTNTTKLMGSSGLETPYNVWPLWSFNSGCGTPNIIYLCVGHEYDPPLFRGAQVLAVNITNGQLIWKELDTSVESSAIAYGKLVTLNAYDNQLYCMGKGPSSITVSAPAVGVTTATPITITGTITDVSPGASQQQTYSNYPNGLPCVSDESESLFMESVYQQQPMYSNMTGVQITLSVVDSNGNFRDIGTTTSDVMGNYGFTWTPDIPGNYQVIASFAGTNSYYPSTTSTYLYAGETPTAAPTASPPTGLATTADLMTYIVGVGIAMIIAIAIVGLLVLRKK